MTHHGQKVGFCAVGTLCFLAGLDQLSDRGLLFAAGLGQAVRQVVNVAGQAAEFTIVNHRQRRIEVPLLNRLHRIAHVADRLGQVGRQAPRQQVGKAQCKQRKDHGFQQDVLLALIEGITGHAHQHPPQVILGGRRHGIVVGSS